MTKVVIVSYDKWRDAIKFLMGLGTNPTLDAKDQKFLLGHLRGPFANGMKFEDACKVLTNAGWQTGSRVIQGELNGER